MVCLWCRRLLGSLGCSQGENFGLLILVDLGGSRADPWFCSKNDPHCSRCVICKAETDNSYCSEPGTHGLSCDKGWRRAVTIPLAEPEHAPASSTSIHSSAGCYLHISVLFGSPCGSC